MQTGLSLSDYAGIVELALAEDIGSGDITTRACISPDQEATARIIVKRGMVLCGIDVARYAFTCTDDRIEFTESERDGEYLDSGDTILALKGPAAAILKAERVALNFLQRLSGIATLTANHVDVLAGTKAKVVDTRKTTPGLRVLEKYAVRCGGGANHRVGLFDGVLIKENHIRAAGSIAKAVAACRQEAHHLLAIEVEVTSLDELQQAIDAGADTIMLDNFELDDIKQAVDVVGGRAKLEVSGNITINTIRAIAETGVDIISVGRLTHSAAAVDISLLFDN